MEFDFDKLLQLDYLNTLKIELIDEIDKISKMFLEQYSLEKLSKMEYADISSIFEFHGVAKTNLIRYLETDFIDEGWEFADLFQDDIIYSTELRAQIKLAALNEIDILNNKIIDINEKYKNDIANLEEYLNFVNIFIRVLCSKDLLLEEDLNRIYNFIASSNLNEEEQYRFSYKFVSLVFDNTSRKSEKDEVDTSDFEKILDDAYLSVAENEEKDLEIVEPSYPETVLTYYNYFKSLFEEVGLGNNLYEIMNVCLEFDLGINDSSGLMSKEDFCIRLGALLSKLNDTLKSDRDTANEVLIDLSLLDNLYSEDMDLLEVKEELLNRINNDLDIISSIEIDNDLFRQVINKLNLLRVDLTNKIIGLRKFKEMNSSYNDMRLDIRKISEIFNQLNRLNKLNDSLKEMISNSYLVDFDVMPDYCDKLNDLQLRVLELIDVINKNDYNSKLDIDITVIEQEWLKYLTFSKKEEEEVEEKIDLKGFVLFDFGEDNIPYVINDLDPSNNKNLIADDALQGQIVSGFEDYNNLINDLLLDGVPRILKNGEALPYMDRILTYVFLDNNRKQVTKMVRIRPMRNSLVRFISHKVALNPGSKIHKQIIEIISENLPNVNISLDNEFVLFVNFCSALKLEDTDSYGISINRYLRKSPLYKLFLENRDNDELTDEECSLLKDIVNMSLDAYVELEKKNENLKFDVIRKIGGKMVHGQ